MRTELFIITLLMIYPSGRAVGQEPRALKELKRQLSTDERSAQLIGIREELIKNLIQIVEEDKGDRSTRVRAVRTLGQFRAVEATQVLVRNIDRIMPEIIDAKTISTIFPCVPALIRIGKPASRAVLKELQKPMKKARRMALAVVLGGVEGRQVGRFMLQHEIAKSKTSQERHNLQLGLKSFLSMTANERNAEELKAGEAESKRKNRR